MNAWLHLMQMSAFDANVCILMQMSVFCIRNDHKIIIDVKSYNLKNY